MMGEMPSIVQLVKISGFLPRTIFILSLLYSLRACQSDRPPTNKVAITFCLQAREPYCGGALPSKSREEGRLQPISALELVVVDIPETARNTGKSFITDSLGKAFVDLSPGTYGIFLKRKVQPFADFLQDIHQDPNSKSQVLSDTSCLEKWWNSPDAECTITAESDSISLTIQKYCNGGFNPCQIYRGPKRP